jgi:hypothetical protein
MGGAVASENGRKASARRTRWHCGAPAAAHWIHWCTRRTIATPHRRPLRSLSGRHQRMPIFASAVPTCATPFAVIHCAPRSNRHAAGRVRGFAMSVAHSCPRSGRLRILRYQHRSERVIRGARRSAKSGAIERHTMQVNAEVMGFRFDARPLCVRKQPRRASGYELFEGYADTAGIQEEHPLCWRNI